MKFATKLALVFSTIFFMVGLIVSLSVYSLNRATLEEAIKNDLQDIAFHTLDKIDRMLSERRADIKILATDPILISKSSTPKQITERLIAFRDIYKRYVSLSFFDLNRVCVADTSETGIGIQHPFAGYWKDILQGKDFAADISRSELLDEVVFHSACTVRDRNGTARGVVVSRVPLNKLYEITRQAAGIRQNIGKYLYIDLVDKNGILVYSNYIRKGIFKAEPPEWSLVRTSLAAGKKAGFLKHRSPGRGEEIIIFSSEQGYLDFYGISLTLLMHIPTEVVFAPAFRLRNIIMAITLVAGILAVLVIVFFSRTISLPIERLSTASHEIERGNFAVRIPVASRDEIGNLTALFNAMVNTLKKNRDRLEAHSKELEIRVAERTSELKTVNEQLQAELTERKRMEEEREQLIRELQDALASIKTLKGLLPICASCKKVRDDQGYWTQTEAYISDHSGAEFTHGLCPDCAKKYYDELAKLKKDNPSGKNHQPPSV